MYRGIQECRAPRAQLLQLQCTLSFLRWQNSNLFCRLLSQVSGLKWWRAEAGLFFDLCYIFLIIKRSRGVMVTCRSVVLHCQRGHFLISQEWINIIVVLFNEKSKANNRPPFSMNQLKMWAMIRHGLHHHFYKHHPHFPNHLLKQGLSTRRSAPAHHLLLKDKSFSNRWKFSPRLVPSHILDGASSGLCGDRSEGKRFIGGWEGCGRPTCLNPDL